jgi:hypothetical protein
VSLKGYAVASAIFPSVALYYANGHSFEKSVLATKCTASCREQTSFGHWYKVSRHDLVHKSGLNSLVALDIKNQLNFTATLPD